MPLDVAGPTVDIVGTGGDGAHTVDVSTMAAIVAAGAGALVVKHGNRSASSACGSADVLERLGIVLELPPRRIAEIAEIAEISEQVGVTCCFAPNFPPGDTGVSAWRRRRVEGRCHGGGGIGHSAIVRAGAGPAYPSTARRERGSACYGTLVTSRR
ncbi:hypothetical protein [Streptomyces adelaidensis]|uniref:hypothetical protein n=1 Tax=Streptomyces adelaidensis TaxID=2796465 RepID=UPI00355867EC